MALATVNFRVEACDGSGIEEYRVHDGDIEVRQARCESRKADRSSLESAYREDQWRRLSASEIASHVHGNTAVAHWLRHRIGWRLLLLACTEKETLEMFGVTEAPINHRAA